MKSKLSLSSFCLKNFKAVQNSKTIKFTPLTVFIGNNGSGKSSIVEAMETFQSVVLNGLDEAMVPWYGFEYIWNMAKTHSYLKLFVTKEFRVTNPMTFVLNGLSVGKRFRAHVEIAAAQNFNRIFFYKYMASHVGGKLMEQPEYIAEDRLTDSRLKHFIENWQFLRLNPQAMTEPIPQKRAHGTVSLNNTGSNIAEYLQSIRDQDIQAFDGIIEALKVVLPFAKDLQPAITSELDRKVYLMMSEENIAGKLPGWLLSTGTLRILAILAVLHHPTPPPVIIIEEIENGLDPRTIHLLVDEIRYFVESGLGQIIVTTHSPYLLDLLKLSQLVVVERDASGSPVFTRPASQKSLQEWIQKFSPGKLYTMGKLKRS